MPTRGQRETLANAVAQRRISATMDIQPWRVPVSSLFALEYLTPEELAEKAAL